ncbi:hypothetical protein ASD71_15300 [Achromobacter sp. Root565]|nr:hypothetical protein ASD71_15300 [Achromobacter sp. Root565]
MLSDDLQMTIEELYVLSGLGSRHCTRQALTVRQRPVEARESRIVASKELTGHRHHSDHLFRSSFVWAGLSKDRLRITAAKAFAWATVPSHTSSIAARRAVSSRAMNLPRLSKFRIA